MQVPIEVRDLEVCIRSRRSVVHALQGISLEVGEKQVVGFIGPNGAGKTTTVHVLLGFTEATSGSAKLFGEDVRHSIARRRIGYLPELPQTYNFLTGRELLHMAGRLFDMKGAVLKDRAAELLELVSMTYAADRKIATYSRGMMQRIGLAQALVNDPDLVILDEPTGGLDPLGRLDVRNIIATLRERGKTVFFSSHELSEVERVCDQVIILVAGQIVAKGPVAELVPAGESLEQFFIDSVRKMQNREVGV
ncbi:MAG: ABC transporter ATP-binding protein [Spartobacteria bacterium]|nr:ABC transporter ATP-binding protein [Spartobacteria bacterium]